MDLKWQDSYSLGVPAIDDQHKRLFDIADELQHHLAQGTSKQIIQKVLAVLADYSSNLFPFEESLMEKLEYPESASHKKKHNEFKKKLLDLFVRNNNGDIKVAVDTFAMIRDWLTNHVTSSRADKSLARFIGKQVTVVAPRD